MVHVVGPESNAAGVHGWTVRPLAVHGGADGGGLAALAPVGGFGGRCTRRSSR